MYDNFGLLFLFHKVDTCFFSLYFGKLTNMSRLSSNEKRWNLWPRQPPLPPPWLGESFIGHDAPLLMYGASQGEAAKSGYSKITPGLAPPKKRTAML